MRKVVESCLVGEAQADLPAADPADTAVGITDHQRKVRVQIYSPGLHGRSAQGQQIHTPAQDEGAALVAVKKLPPPQVAVIAKEPVQDPRRQPAAQRGQAPGGKG